MLFAPHEAPAVTRLSSQAYVSSSAELQTTHSPVAFADGTTTASAARTVNARP